MYDSMIKMIVEGCTHSINATAKEATSTLAALLTSSNASDTVTITTTIFNVVSVDQMFVISITWRDAVLTKSTP